MRAATLLFAALALAGCAISAEKIGLPGAGSKTSWDMQASATAGAAIIQRAGDGHETLRIACRRNPADLYVASGLPAEPGALALQVGAQTFPLTALEGPTFTAAGPWPDALPAALMSGETLRLAVGGRTWAFALPDAKTAAAFAIACRGPVR